MKLRRLSIDRMPGIDRPFELRDLGDGLNIIVGPNGIGKSQVCAAVRALLWHERGIADNGLTARAIFGHESDSWSVVRDGSLHAWQRDGIDAVGPALPGDRLVGCFFLGLRDLLDDSERAGRDLAGEVRRQMSGNFDLEGVHRGFENAVPVRGGSRENKELAAAEREIRQAEQNQSEVERGEGELESLKIRAAEAELASKRVAAVQAALSRLSLEEDLSHRRHELDSLPSALANLDGKETARLDGLEEELLRRRTEQQAATTAVAASQASVEETRLGQAIDSATLATWRGRAEKLGELERNLEAARIASKVAFESVAQRQRSLGTRSISAQGGELEEPLDLEDGALLFEFLKESEERATDTRLTEERLALFAGREFSDEDSKRLELLKRGVSPLREWLRAPASDRDERAVGFWPSRNVMLMTGGLLIAVGMLAEFVVPALAGTGGGLAVIGLGVGLAVSGLLSRVQSEVATDSISTDWRSIAKQRYPEALESPEAWQIEAVEDRLNQLEDEVAKFDAKEKRAEIRRAECAPLEQKLKGLEQRAGEFEVRREALLKKVGLDSLRTDIERVDLAQGLAALRDVTVEARAAERTVDSLEETRNGVLEGLAAGLASFGESETVDAAACRAGVQNLEERDRAFRAATIDGAREEAARDRLDSEIERLEGRRSEVFSAAGIESPDRLELMRLLGDLPRYQALKLECADLKSRFDRATADLDAAGEAGLAGRSRTELSDEHARLEAAAAGRDEVMAQIVKIRERARDAREGHVLEAAIASRGATLESLHDRRDEALAALAGQFLVDQIRHEHETNQMPRVLARARDRFGVFTHHRYELKVSPDDGGSFIAVEGASGLGLRPEQLSDGTRAQLILAARLAFAEEAEQGADLPIFLDEAMDHSDPERFHAIARSLAHMVMNDDRQIFYLSNDPTDVERFRNAFDDVGCERLQRVDLGEIRGQAARTEDPETLRVAPLAEVPSLGDRDAANYGVAIGVPSLDPRGDPRSHHLFYVLREDLSLLHDLLVERIVTAGQWLNLFEAGTDFAKNVATRSAAGAQLGDRIALLETFCLAWREGRGRTVGRAELERSGAVTEKYLAGLVEIAGEFGGDASQLLSALRDRKDPRLSGYRTKATEDLERFFEEHGYIDAKPILDLNEIVERALGTPAANRLSPGATADLMHAWWSLAGVRPALAPS